MKKSVLGGFMGFFGVVLAGSAMAQQPPPTRFDNLVVPHIISGSDFERVYITQLLLTNRRDQVKEFRSWGVFNQKGEPVRVPALYDNNQEVKNFSGSNNGGRPEMLPIPANGIRRITILPEGYDPNLGPCQGSGELKPSWASFLVPSTLMDRGYDGVRYWAYEPDIDVQMLVSTVNCRGIVTSAASTPTALVLGSSLHFTMPIYYSSPSLSSGVAVVYPVSLQPPDKMDVEITLRNPEGQIMKNPDGTSAVEMIRMETGRLQQFARMVHQIFPKLQSQSFFGTLEVRLIKSGQYVPLGAVWGLRIDSGEDGEVRLSNLTATLK